MGFSPPNPLAGLPWQLFHGHRGFPVSSDSICGGQLLSSGALLPLAEQLAGLRASRAEIGKLRRYPLPFLPIGPIRKEGDVAPSLS